MSLAPRQANSVIGEYAYDYRGDAIFITDIAKVLPHPHDVNGHTRVQLKSGSTYTFVGNVEVWRARLLNGIFDDHNI